MQNLSDLFPGGRCPTASEPEYWNQSRRRRAAPQPAQPQFHVQPAPMMVMQFQMPPAMQFSQQPFAHMQPCLQQMPPVPRFRQQLYAQVQPYPLVPQFAIQRPYQHVQQPFPQMQRPNHRRFPRAAPRRLPSRPQYVPACPSNPPPAPSSPPPAPSTPPPPPSSPPAQMLSSPAEQVLPQTRFIMPSELASSSGLESDLSKEGQQVWDKALSQIRKMAGYAPNAEMWAEKKHPEFGNLRYYLNLDSRREVMERPVVTNDGSVVVLDEAECQRLREVEATIPSTKSSG